MLFHFGLKHTFAAKSSFIDYKRGDVYLCQAYKFDILKKTQGQKNSKLKEKTQGFNKINLETEGNYSISAKKMHSPINP